MCFFISGCGLLFTDYCGFTKGFLGYESEDNQVNYIIEENSGTNEHKIKFGCATTQGTTRMGVVDKMNCPYHCAC